MIVSNSCFIILSTENNKLTEQHGCCIRQYPKQLSQIETAMDNGYEPQYQEGQQEGYDGGYEDQQYIEEQNQKQADSGTRKVLF